MLLNQFKTGATAAPALGRGGLRARDGVAVRKGVSLRVRPAAAGAAAGAGASEDAALLKSATTATSASGTMLGALSSMFGMSTKEAHGPDMVVYKGTVTVMKKLLKLDLVDRGADIQDDVSELRGKHVSVQLVSNEVDPRTGKGSLSSPRNIEGWVWTRDTIGAHNYTYKLEFPVPRDFGMPGAILVKNDHPNEFFLVSFSLTLPDKTELHFMTNSWVYNTANMEGRIFFQNKAYLPHETPVPLKALREEELRLLRGDGTGKREERDRIYDYDVYNDLGNPDERPDLERPPLGNSKEYPYPRRCRTGRPPTKTNAKYESVNKATGGIPPSYYIPRDEIFGRTKNSDFFADNIRSKLHGTQTFAATKGGKKVVDFQSFDEIKRLFAPRNADLGGLNHVLPDSPDLPKEEQHPFVFLQELVKPDGEWNTPLQYPYPPILQADENAWQSDNQFAREFLAGGNPIMISNVKEFPIKSSLDPKEFGDPTSAITAQHIEGRLEGLSTDEAVTQKKLFVADYHDAFLPFVERINKQENSKTYATRALFFLSSDDTLKVLAIELVLPPTTRGGAKRSRVFTPPITRSAKLDYIWMTARAYVANNDTVAHQAFSHWTNCHAVAEPAIIATNRQLSKLHPIYQLMAPHFKGTMHINQGARGRLVCAGGTIETTFTPRAYSFLMAAANYGKNWTFDSQALPNDLLARGMAVPDSGAKHGVKLVVQDYPYAADGLEIWDALHSFNEEYINLKYKDDAAVRDDVELANWWHEIRYKGHFDKKDADGWPELNSKSSLAYITTTIQWVPSGQHAAVNFGQYAYSAFMPHHPTITRRLFPDEGTKEWEEVRKNPQKFFFSTISDKDTTTRTMCVFEILSSHSPDELYLGEREENWIEDPQVSDAFKRFAARLTNIDELIKKRNADPSLKNRLGDARLAYELLRPKSKQGLTAMGVPNSITI